MQELSLNSIIHSVESTKNKSTMRQPSRQFFHGRFNGTVVRSHNRDASGSGSIRTSGKTCRKRLFDQEMDRQIAAPEMVPVRKRAKISFSPVNTCLSGQTDTTDKAQAVLSVRPSFNSASDISVINSAENLCTEDISLVTFKNRKGELRQGVEITVGGKAMRCAAELMCASGMPWCFSGSLAMAIWAKTLDIPMPRQPRDIDVVVKGSCAARKKERDAENRQKLSFLSGFAYNKGWNTCSNEGTGDAILARIKQPAWGDCHMDVLVEGDYGSMEKYQVVDGFPVASLAILQARKKAILKEMADEPEMYTTQEREEQQRDFDFLGRLLNQLSGREYNI